ncbi:MAG: YihY family inner membrane protein [Burkholderiales bacterium]|nr:YihY family inner membrane protein [Burkholderiales bacterium]
MRLPPTNLRATGLKLWRFAAAVGQRLVSDRCLEVAASLTFTTLFALVPLLTIAITVFAALPVAKELMARIHAFLGEQLLPPAVADTILGYVHRFAQQAAGLTAVGLAVLAVTAVTLMATIERAFNTIWRVRRPRPLGVRIVVYWGALTLGPILVGASLWATSYVVVKSLGYVQGLPGAADAVLALVPFASIATAFTLLYMLVPNRAVRFRHALIAGVVAAVLFEAMKRALAFYLSGFATYTAVYGAFAAVPIFLLWLYLSWVVTVLGAVIAAMLPEYGLLRARRDAGAASWFTDALALLAALVAARRIPRALAPAELARTAGVPLDRTEELLERLAAPAWVARTDQDLWILSCDAEQVTVGDVYRLVVSGPPAQGADAVARELAERIDAAVRESLRQPIAELARQEPADRRRLEAVR